MTTYMFWFCLQPESLTVTQGPTLTMLGEGSSILSANMGEMHKTQKTVSLIILLLLVLRVEEDYGPHQTRLVFM